QNLRSCRAYHVLSRLPFLVQGMMPPVPIPLVGSGITSVSSKVKQREALTIHPDDAAARGIGDGDVLRVFNGRGECLAGARVSEVVRPGVIVLPTGAWYDPESPGGIDRHGNPNVLTLDRGTSRLAQGSIAHSALVEVERFEGEPPAVAVFEPPGMSDGR
ncbi:MAG: molybdopterin dinucleotide binding domain-containing protein, partial [Dehalococcoidia bacterium]|nr:molybdopterin dinucleotide binding domain-containing protein [Dehalococcoidia bacterium]